MVSDLKSDLGLTTYQRRPNLQLTGNPAVIKTNTSLHQMKTILSLQLDCFHCRHTRKIYLPANRKGCNESETTYEKPLARRVYICYVHVCVIKFHLFLNNFQYNLQTTMYSTEPASSHQILLYQGLKSF